MMDGQDFLPAIRPETPEARLFQAVILQAIKDRDWTWFYPDTEDDALDYLEVCELAGVDGEALRSRVLRGALMAAARHSLGLVP